MAEDDGFEPPEPISRFIRVAIERNNPDSANPPKSYQHFSNDSQTPSEYPAIGLESSSKNNKVPEGVTRTESAVTLFPRADLNTIKYVIIYPSYNMNFTDVNWTYPFLFPLISFLWFHRNQTTIPDILGQSAHIMLILHVLRCI
jgi:hypothetical protein